MLDVVIAAVAILAITAIAILYLFRPSKKSLDIPGLDPRSREHGNQADISDAGSLHKFLCKLHKDYGPIASFWNGPDFTVSIASPELFREQQHLFNRPASLFKLFEPMIGKESIQFANDEEGKWRRKMYDRAFSSEAMKLNYPSIQMVTDEMIEKWEASINDRVGLSKDLLSLTIKANAMITLGKRFLDERIIATIHRSYVDSWKEVENLLLGSPSQHDEYIGRLTVAVADLRDVIQEVINERKAETSGGEIPGDHLLDCLINSGLPDDVIISDALSFMVAGFHSTGYMLVWAFYYMATHPEVQEKAAEEAKTVLSGEDVDDTNVKSLVYIRQVVNETLRCAIIGTFAGRYDNEDSTLGGYHIPKGTPVIQALGVIGQDEKYWPEPEKFDPERFSPENATKQPQMAFQPFGFAGKRKCPGYRLTYGEGILVIATVLRRFRVRLVDGQNVTMVYSVIARPAEEIWVTVEKRE